MMTLNSTAVSSLARADTLGWQRGKPPRPSAPFAKRTAPPGMSSADETVSIHNCFCTTGLTCVSPLSLVFCEHASHEKPSERQPPSNRSCNSNCHTQATGSTRDGVLHDAINSKGGGFMPSTVVEEHDAYKTIAYTPFTVIMIVQE